MSTLAVAVGKHDHVQGPADAPVTLVEYGDYQCPTCEQAYFIVKRLQKHFGETLRFVFRNFPLEQHQFAEAAAETAEFAASHGRFWEMHDALYENQRRLNDNLLTALAAKLDLNTDALNKALRQGTYQDRVQIDVQSGDASGVRGTPSFYINGHLNVGSFDYEALANAIQNALT